MTLPRITPPVGDAPAWRAELLALRYQHRLTQADVAHLLHVSVRTVARWEHGTREPHPFLVASFRERLEHARPSEPA